jgi:hypothetical protein
MNKYLEKIASIGERIGKVAKPPKGVSPGSNLVKGDKTILNAALHKAAQDQTNWKHDAIDTGIIGGLGGATSYGVNKMAPKIIGNGMGKMHNAKLFALGTAAGLAADYAGVKLNKAINNDVQKQVS